GKVGTGFRDKEQQEMIRLFKPLIRKTSPFSETPDYNKPSRFKPKPPHAEVTWLRPELVCEIHFAEVTTSGVFRHPAFIALREDKDPKTVTTENEVPVGEVVKKNNNAKKDKDSMVKTSALRGQDVLVNPDENTQVRKVNGIELKCTNLKKILWPEEGYSKGDMLNYYWQVA